MYKENPMYPKRKLERLRVRTFVVILEGNLENSTTTLSTYHGSGENYMLTIMLTFHSTLTLLLKHYAHICLQHCIEAHADCRQFLWTLKIKPNKSWVTSMWLKLRPMWVTLVTRFNSMNHMLSSDHYSFIHERQLSLGLESYCCYRHLFEFGILNYKTRVDFMVYL